jgi:LuxR family maltose regulon positive regulatory protein
VSSQQPEQNCPALEMLDHGNRCKLVLLVAPAGAGKTRLIRQWSQQNEETLCWSLLWIVVENKTRNLSGFLKKLSNGITMWDQNIEANAEVSVEIQKEQIEFAPHDPEDIPDVSPHLETILNQLLNRLMHLPRDRFIIILNYQNFHDPRIHSVIGYLLDFLPQNIHMIISSEEQPALPIPRLRARRELIEIDPDDMKSGSK